MAVRYRVREVPNTPGSFFCQVVEIGTSGPNESVQAIADGTQQTTAVVHAVLGGIADLIETNTLAGRGTVLPGLGKVSFSIEATLDGIDAPMPAERRLRVRMILERPLTDRINDGVEYERLDPVNLNPIIQSVEVENGVISALTSAALITFRGARLEFDPDDVNQGIFLQGPTGAPIRVAANRIKSHPDGKTEWFWPAGLTANTNYTVTLKGAPRDSDLIRTSNTITGFHNA